MVGMVGAPSTSFTLALVVASVLTASPVVALVIRQPLDATGVDGDAAGRARVVVKGRGDRRHATLTVKVRRLAGGAHFDVTVDGTPRLPHDVQAGPRACRLHDPLRRHAAAARRRPAWTGARRRGRRRARAAHARR